MKLLNCNCGLPIFVDDEDYDFLSTLKWGCQNGTAVKSTNHDYVMITHTLIDVPIGMFVDHIDRNCHNNQKTNLRLATKAQNCQNAKIRKDNVCGYKGVHYRKDNNKYRARIQVNHVRLNLGEYDTAKEAAIAYNKAAALYHKEFAVLNEV